MPDDLLKDILGDREYDENAWHDVQTEAGIDMQYVSGNPWTEDDLKIRKGRPTVAPEEMSQYRNQVVNGLMANPRGAMFSPKSIGTTDAQAEFYQNKWREIEYRSNGPQQYIIAVDNALQRSYGFMRVRTDYASPRSVNQDIWLEAFPDPDMVLPDGDGKQLDGSDWKRATIKEPITKREFQRLYPNAKVVSFDDSVPASQRSQWRQGDRLVRAECWRVETRPRRLVLVEIPPPPMPMGAPRPSAFGQVFEDELRDLRARVPGLIVKHVLRVVDFPTVKVYMTNGLEILSESDWPSQYIPIVPCYGKVLYVPKHGESTKIILSLTRFGRAPWKSYCYACSQELEVLGMVPKAPLLAAEGQFAGHEQALQDSLQTPTAFLYYKATTEDTGPAVLPRPEPITFPGGQYLQALEIVKEGMRRAIQAAMGSNFLPTNAQRINDKSGKALDKIDEVATQGTYHFIYAFEGMIRRCATIGEDLIDKIYDYQGETAVRTADHKTAMVAINGSGPEAISTQGEFGVTVSTAPSTDSERDAADAFTSQLLQELQGLAPIVGPDAVKAMLAISIRMRGPQLGPMAEKLASLVEPAFMKTGDGTPPDPQLLQAQQQIQQLQQHLQQLGFVIQTKQVEGQTQYAIAQLKTQATSADKAADRAVKLDVAAIEAKIETMAMVVEELQRIGGLKTDAAQRLHEAGQAVLDRQHQQIENAKDRLHEHVQNTLDRAAAAHAIAPPAAEAEPQPEPVA